MDIKSLQILYEHLLNDRDYVRSMMPGLSIAAADTSGDATRRNALNASSYAQALLQELTDLINALRAKLPPAP